MTYVIRGSGQLGESSAGQSDSARRALTLLKAARAQLDHTAYCEQDGRRIDDYELAMMAAEERVAPNAPQGFLAKGSSES